MKTMRRTVSFRYVLSSIRLAPPGSVLHLAGASSYPRCGIRASVHQPTGQPSAAPHGNPWFLRDGPTGSQTGEGKRQLVTGVCLGTCLSLLPRASRPAAAILLFAYD